MMFLLLRAVSLFCLIHPLVAFGFVSAQLGTLLRTPSDIPVDELYASAAVSVAAFVIALAAIISVGCDLTRRGHFLRRKSRLALGAVGICSMIVALPAFFLVASKSDVQYFSYFFHAARFEFLMIGFACTLAFAATPKLLPNIEENSH